MNEELSSMDFTSEKGEDIFENLKEQLKRNPTQYEFDNMIDFEYEKYLDGLREKDK